MARRQKRGVLDPRFRDDESRLYPLAALKQGGAHVLRLGVKGKLRLFAFTFGEERFGDIVLACYFVVF